MTTVGDFPILGPPSISLSQFQAILQSAGSPATPEAPGMYSEAIAYGVDPAVLLAIFQHESSFGRAGVATRTHSVGNLVWTPASATVGAWQAGRWAAYPSWTAGAADAARLLSSSLYGRSSTFNTVRTFPYRWAPASDGNNPASYGAAVASSIAQWTGESGKPYVTSSSTKPNVSSAAPSGPHRTGPAPGAGAVTVPAWPFVLTLAAAGLIVLLIVVL